MRRGGAGSRSSAASAMAWSGTARVLPEVLVVLIVQDGGVAVDVAVLECDPFAAATGLRPGAAVAMGAADVQDGGVAVDVAVLECDPFAGS